MSLVENEQVEALVRAMVDVPWALSHPVGEVLLRSLALPLVPVLSGLLGCASIFGLDETRLPDGPPVAVPVPSCRALAATAPSGVYSIDTGSQFFSAYCEQEADGGGWTLAMKVDGRLATFAYDSTLWTRADLLNPGSPGRDYVEAKLATFSALPVAEVRLEFESPIESGTRRSVVLSMPANTLASLLNETRRGSALGREQWLALAGPTAVLQNGCNLEGANVLTSTPNFNQYARVRFGIITNDIEDCMTAESYVGVGGWYGLCTLVGASPTSAGNAGCNGVGPASQAAFVWIYVR